VNFASVFKPCGPTVRGVAPTSLTQPFPSCLGLSLRRAVTDERLEPNDSRIIPGDWGKVEPGWLVRPLFEPRREARWEATFTSSSGSVRALSVPREAGTARPETMRNRFEPSQVTHTSFECGRITVTQRANRLLLCASTERTARRSRRRG